MSPPVMWSTPATSAAARSRATTPTATSAACAKSATSTSEHQCPGIGTLGAKFQSSVGASAPLPPPRRLYRPARTVPVRAGRTFFGRRIGSPRRFHRPSTGANACPDTISAKPLIFQHNESSKNREPNADYERLLGMRGRKASPDPGRDRTQGFRNSIGASAPPSTPAPIESTRSDSPRSSGSYPFRGPHSATHRGKPDAEERGCKPRVSKHEGWASGDLRRLLGQPAAKEKLSDARVGENRRRGVGDAGAAKLQHDAVVGDFQRALGVLLDHQHRDAAGTHLGQRREQFIDHQRREPDRGLVDHHQLRLEQQRARDLKDLLLAAGERGGL